MSKRSKYILVLASLIWVWGLGCRLTRLTPTPTRAALPSPTLTLSDRPTATATSRTTTPTPQKSSRRNELRLYSQQPETLDPAITQDMTSHRFVILIFSGLVTLDANLEVSPDLAERWEVDSSGTVYTFYLRKNARFHNGRPVTAQDVRYSLERACDPNRGSVQRAQSYLNDIVGVMARTAGDADSISGVQVVDDWTIRITIDAPKPYFLAKLTYPTSFVVDREQVDKPDWTTQPNGSGPFKLQEANANRMTLAAFDQYHLGRPSLDRVIWYHRGQAMNLYERDELDVIEVSADYIDRVLNPQDPLHADLRIVPQLNISYIGFNCTIPPFDDVHVRRALALATNKKAIADIFFNKTVIPAQGILPPGMPGYNPDLQGLDFDQARAVQELNLSTYGDASELPPIVLTITGAGMGEMLAEMYQQALGVQVQVEVVGWGKFLQGLDAQQYQMFSLAWGADYPDPENFLDLLFHSESAYNHGAYNNEKLDALVEQARIEQDHDRRMVLYRQAEELLVQDAPWIPLYHSGGYYLVKPYVKDMIITAQEMMNLSQVRVERP